MQKQIEEAARRAQLIYEAKKRNEESLIERMNMQKKKDEQLL